MRFAVVILACVLAVASAQLNTGRYTPNAGQYQYNKYKPSNQFNRYNTNNNQYNRYNKNQYNPNQYNPFNSNYNRNQQQQQYTPFKPFVSSTTPFPRPSVTVTPAPLVVPKETPAPFIPPFVPAVTPTPFVPVITAARIASADARSAETVKYGNDINPDGSYSYFYETNNGIAAQAQGTPRNFGGNPPVIPDVAQGSFSWIAPEGQVIAINWVADENGYQATGDAIPQPPPLPDQIARAFAYIARNSPVPAVAKVNSN